MPVRRIDEAALKTYADLLPEGITTRGTPPNEYELEAMRVMNAVNFLEAMGVIVQVPND